MAGGLSRSVSLAWPERPHRFAASELSVLLVAWGRAGQYTQKGPDFQPREPGYVHPLASTSVKPSYV